VLKGVIFRLYGTIDIPILEHFFGSDTVAWCPIA
jgi:hypothetical protein